MILSCFVPISNSTEIAEQDPLIGKPVVGRNADGHLELFKIDSDGELRHSWQKISNGDWSAWQDFGGTMKPGISLGQSADGRLEILAVDARDGTLLHRWENLVDGSDQWSIWKTMGATAQPYPAVGRNEDGNLEVFAVDATNGAAINHRRQISRASDWLDWSTASVVECGSPLPLLHSPLLNPPQ